MASLLLGLYILLVRSSVFWVPFEGSPHGAGPFSAWLYEWIGHNTLPAQLLAMALLLAQGFYLNIIVSENRLAAEVSLFPGVFYVLLASLLPEFVYLSPLLLGNTFYLIVLGEVFNSYKKTEAAGDIFNIGFWTGAGALFYPSFLALLLVGFVGLNILRAFKIRERLMALAGLFVPFFLTGTWLFWDGGYPEYAQQVKSGFAWLDFSPAPVIAAYRSLGIMAVLILVLIVSYRSYLLKQSIDVQRKISIVFWGLLLSALTVFFQADIGLEHLLILTLPAGLLLSLNFIRLPRQTAEVLHLLLLALALALQFQPLLFSA
ncbi:hypothetical protein [Phaeodactylibacter luteus]|uniref:Beta-carotene 15,15'-monooxygenase n=1 Tax=Phaeodactylibacter luteus TaxID=1564516 RepID=A0A5C6RGL5_9BACT|nr:hypothetical protein [Phaeodactylibacter luteus]TXB61578.1 hypothetical protein FRY97_18465 [Phaeodactylibacter luteus]